MVENRSLILRMLRPLAVIAAYTFIYLPIIVLVAFSFNDARISLAWEGFSFRWYLSLASNPELMSALRTSLVVAFTSSMLCLALGTSLVVGSAWRRAPNTYRLFLINLALPDIMLAIGVLSMFNFMQLSLGYASLIIGHTLIGLGFVVPIIRARFLELDPVLTEASLDLGASYFQTFYKILLPLLAPSLLASGLITFTLSLDDFLVAFFCTGSSVQTLSMYVYSMMRSAIDPSINAVSTCLLLASSLVVVILASMNLIDEVF